MHKSWGRTGPREESDEAGVEGRDSGKSVGGEGPAFQLPKGQDSGANSTPKGYNCGIWEAGWMDGPWFVSDTVIHAMACGIVGEQVHVTERETSQRTQQIRLGLGEHRPCL